MCAFDAKERGPQYPAGSGGYIVAKPMKTQKNSFPSLLTGTFLKVFRLKGGLAQVWFELDWFQNRMCGVIIFDTLLVVWSN